MLSETDMHLIFVLTNAKTLKKIYFTNIKLYQK